MTVMVVFEVLLTLFFYYTAITTPKVSCCLCERPETPERTVALEQVNLKNFLGFHLKIDFFLFLV